MCGIAGIVGRNSLSKSEEALDDLLRRMVQMFNYRGPDDEGTWLSADNYVGLAHKRLSIIDPSPAGHQPMLDSATGNVLVFNGEVYNYIEIRTELQALGAQFDTDTDTEVILKAYAHWGVDAIHKFNGMFAIALWDSLEQQLLLVRDRLGIKPLYYYQNSDEALVFASEVKAITEVEKRQWTADIRLIDEYMAFGYIPGEDTLHKGIKRLLPGHWAIFKDGSLTIKQYWDVSFENETDEGLDAYAQNTLDLLNDSIDLRLRSDVPLGVFLSGGLDSSAVVGLLAKRSSATLKTFSVSYDFGKEYDETPHARKVSKHFGTEHHEIKVDPKSFEAFIPQYIQLMDEPVTEAAAISLQYVSQLAREQVTVVLSGEGSDELFGGYDFYRYMAAIERYRSTVGHRTARFLGTIGSKLFGFHPKLAKYFALSTQPLEERYRGISSYGEQYRNELYRSEVKKQLLAGPKHPVKAFLARLFKSTESCDPLSRMLYFDTKTWLVDDLLIKADRMSMASSLELRVPFLDYRLVELAAKMPSQYKICNGNPKFILKHITKDFLPPSIIERKKMGFPTPLKMMFQHELSGYVKQVLMGSDVKIHKIFEPSVIKSYLDEHYAGKSDHHRVLWQLIVLEEWLQHNKVEIEIGAADL